MRQVIGLCALLFLLTLPASAAPERLSHRGRWLTDSQGRIVILHGVNMVSKLPPFTPAAMGFDEDDAALLESAGLNCVRVGVIYSAVEPKPGQYDDNYLDQIEQTVALLHKHHILSLLDFHQDLYGPRFQGEGFPLWATFDDGLPAAPDKGFPENYFVMPGLQRAFDNLWANRGGLQERYAAAWAHTARRFRDTPGVLGYDVINEPFPGSKWKECIRPQGCTDFDTTLTRFQNKVVKAIQSVDPTTLIFCEPCILMGLGADTHVGKFEAFSFHDYKPPYTQILTNALRYQQRSGAALLMTEWGATTDSKLISHIATLNDSAMMPWIYWTYANSTPYKIPQSQLLPGGAENQGIVLNPAKPLTAGNLLEDRLNALARPYPRAIAGTPRKWSFNPQTKAFSLAFVPKAGRTAIVMPARQYPDGYQVRAIGATVVSEPGAPLLEMETSRGARMVRVDATKR